MKSARDLPPPDYEPGDAAPTTIVVTAASLAGIVTLGIGVAALLHSRATGRPPPAETLFQHGPDSRSSVEESWDEVDHEAQENLEGYAWIDRKAGIVRIPIERAMDMICRDEKTPTGKPEGKGAAP